MNMYDLSIIALVLLMATRAFWGFLVISIVIGTIIAALFNLLTFQFVDAFGFIALLIIELMVISMFPK